MPTASPASCARRRRSPSSSAAKSAVKSAVVAWATAVSAEEIRSSPHASSVNGTAVPTMPAKATARQ